MSNFTEAQKLAAWRKAATKDGYDSTEYRFDSCGAKMYWGSYGKQTDLGWEIDHIFPEAKGGKDDLDNLRAMHHANNASKGDDYPSYSCSVTYNGKSNVTAESNRTVHVDTRNKLKKLYGKKAE